MNTTTLNMTTLDGGVIIKKGEGGGSTPPSGGESGGEREVSYYSIPKDANEVLKRVGIGYATYIKGTPANSSKCIEMAGAFVLRGSDNVHEWAEAVTIEWDAFHTNATGTSLTCREHLEQELGWSMEMFSQFLPPITKEQFYSLD